MDKILQRMVRNYYIENPNRKRINTDLVYGLRQESLIDYIIDAYKSLELIRHVKLLDYEYIDKASEFDIDVINRKYLKSKLDKKIEKFIYIDQSRFGLLKARFKLTINGETKIKEVRLLLPKNYKKYYMFLGGNKFYPIYQLVDSSTYTNKEYVTLKSMFMPIIVKRNLEVMKDISDNEYSIPYYTVFLFKRKANPLLYYLATFGFENMLRYMNMEDIIDISDTNDGDDDYLYFKISGGRFVKVIKEFFEKDQFCQHMTYAIQQCMNQFKVATLKLNNTDIWCEKLGSLFTTTKDSQLDKGKNIILSFYRLLDRTTYRNLKLKEYNKHNIYAILRWMMRNFSDLKSKDNMDLKNKRIRLSEYVAFYFIKRLSMRANKLLSRKCIEMDDLEDLLNFPQDDLIKQIYKSKSPLLRYDNTVNDMDLFTSLKFSSKGPGSLGEKSSNAINIKYRGVHPSHVGVIDINTSGTSDPGMGSLFTLFAKTYGQHFDLTDEPQGWDKRFKKLYRSYFGEEYEEKGLIYFYQQNKPKKQIVHRYEDVFHFIKYDRYYYEFNDLIQLTDVKKIDIVNLDKKKKKKLKKLNLKKLEDKSEMKSLNLKKLK